MYSSSNKVVRGVEVKKSEIRFKSENLHPSILHGKDMVGGKKRKDSESEAKSSLYMYLGVHPDLVRHPVRGLRVDREGLRYPSVRGLPARRADLVVLEALVGLVVLHLPSDLVNHQVQTALGFLRRLKEESVGQVVGVACT